MADRGAGGRFAPGNILGQSSFGYAVGDKAFLASEASRVAKYFREIETGTDIFIGRPLMVLPRRRPNAEGKVSDLRDAKRMLEEHAKTGFQNLHPKAAFVIVERGIQPHLAYQKAAEAFNPAQREREAIAQAFEQAGVRPGEAGGRSAPTKAGSRTFRSRLGGRFIRGEALSTGSLNLARIDSVFRAELTAANKLLAEALAAEVAAAYQETYVRSSEERSGRLEEATLDRRNRFPS